MYFSWSSLIIGMWLGPGLIAGAIYLTQPPARPGIDLAPGESMVMQMKINTGEGGEYTTIKELRLETSFTVDGCSVSCGRTLDDIVFTAGHGCGTRQIALCQERWGLQEPQEAPEVTLSHAPLVQTCMPGYHEEPGEEAGTGHRTVCVKDQT